MVPTAIADAEALSSKMSMARQTIAKLNNPRADENEFEKSVGLRRQYLESLSDTEDSDEEELNSESRSDDRGHDWRERVEPVRDDSEAAHDDHRDNSDGHESDNKVGSDSEYMESISFYARREDDDRIFELSEDDDDGQEEEEQEEDDHTDPNGADESTGNTEAAHRYHQGDEDISNNPTQENSNLTTSEIGLTDNGPMRENDKVAPDQDNVRSSSGGSRKLDHYDKDGVSQAKVVGASNDTPTTADVSPSKSDTYVFEEDEPSIGFIQSSGETSEMITDDVVPDKRTFDNYSPFDALEEEDYRLPKGSDLAVLMQRDNYSPFDALEEEDYKLPSGFGANTHESNDSNGDSYGDSHSTMAHSNLSKTRNLVENTDIPITTSPDDFDLHSDGNHDISLHKVDRPADSEKHTPNEDVAAEAAHVVESDEEVEDTHPQSSDLVNHESLEESDSLSPSFDAITELKEGSMDEVEKAHHEIRRISPSEDLEDIVNKDEGNTNEVGTEDEENDIAGDAEESRDLVIQEEDRRDEHSDKDEMSASSHGVFDTDDQNEEEEQPHLDTRSFNSKHSSTNSEAPEVIEETLNEDLYADNYTSPRNEETAVEVTPNENDDDEEEEILRNRSGDSNREFMEKDGDDEREMTGSINHDHDYDNESTGLVEVENDPSVDEIVDIQSDVDEEFRSSSAFSSTYVDGHSVAPVENEQEAKSTFEDPPYLVDSEQETTSTVNVEHEEQTLERDEDEVLPQRRSIGEFNVDDNNNPGQSRRAEFLMAPDSVTKDNFATTAYEEAGGIADPTSNDEVKDPQQLEKSEKAEDSASSPNGELMQTDSQLSFDEDDDEEENPLSFKKPDEDSGSKNKSSQPPETDNDETRLDRQALNLQFEQVDEHSPYHEDGVEPHYESETNDPVEKKERPRSGHSKADSLGELLGEANEKSGAAKPDLYASFMAQRGEDMAPPLVVMESNSSLSSSSSKFETNDVTVISQEAYGFSGGSDFPYAIYSSHTQPAPRTPPQAFAGNRLYNQGIQKQRTKAIYKKNDANVKRNNNLDLATRNYGSNKRSSSVSSARKGMSVYNRLYNVTTKGKQLESEAKKTDPSPVRSRSLSRPRSAGSRSGPRSNSTFSRVTSTPKYDRTNKKDDESMIAVQSTTRTSSRTRSRNPDGMTTSERLYNLAKKKRILEMERERRKRCEEESNFKQKSSPRNGPSVPILGQPDIYSRLYHLAKSKRDEKEKRLQRAREEKKNAEARYKSPYRLTEREAQEGFSRLYSKSFQQQLEGRKRRDAIAMKNAPQRDYTPSRKIKPEEAADLYNRGMVQKMQLEIKREEEGLTTDYVSPLLNPLVEYPKGSPTPSKPRERAMSTQRSQSRSRTASNDERSSSRIRTRSRLRSMSPDVRSKSSFVRNVSQTPVRNRTPIANRSTTPQKQPQRQQETPVTSRAPTPVSRSSRRSYTPSRSHVTPNTRTRSPTPTRARESTPMRRQKQDSTRQLLRKLENEMHTFKGDAPRKETDTIKTASTKGTSGSERTYPREKEYRKQLSPTEESNHYLTRAQSDDYY